MKKVQGGKKTKVIELKLVLSVPEDFYLPAFIGSLLGFMPDIKIKSMKQLYGKEIAINED